MAILFLIDIENLCGGRLNFKKAQKIKHDIALIAGVEDYFLVFGCDPAQQKLVTSVFPKEINGKVVMEGVSHGGKDGADLGLRLWVQRHSLRLKEFRAVVVASGDHFFLDELAMFKKLNKKFIIVHGEGAVSNQIREKFAKRIFRIDSEPARTALRGKAKSESWRQPGSTALFSSGAGNLSVVLTKANRNQSWVGGTLYTPFDSALAESLEAAKIGKAMILVTTEGERKVCLVERGFPRPN